MSSYRGYLVRATDLMGAAALRHKKNAHTREGKEGQAFRPSVVSNHVRKGCMLISVSYKRL
jgi:hypothetical protein